MVLLCLFIALTILQWSTIVNHLHKDQWFYNWLDWLSVRVNTASNPRLFPLLALACPLLALSISLALLAKISLFLVFLVSIVLLLYSFGRGDWIGSVAELRSAYRTENKDVIEKHVANWLPESFRRNSDWREQAVVGIVYYAFELTFVVLFWFLLLGPVGAVFYRLTTLLKNAKALEGADNSAVARWHWLLEWPAIRLLGLSFSFVGNFAGCYRQWKTCFLCLRRDTQTVLAHYIQGALTLYKKPVQYHTVVSDDDFEDAEDEIEVDIDAAVGLYRRALLFWLCILAILWML